MREPRWYGWVEHKDDGDHRTYITLPVFEFVLIFAAAMWLGSCVLK